jgi:colicin import membrane protein
MESDGINEGLQREMQILLAAATQRGRKLAQLHETMQRRAARQSQQEADRLRSRLDSERAAARVVVDQTRDPQWWDRARPEQIADTYRVARAWEDVDRDILAGRERMDRELTTRYGMTPLQAAEIGREQIREAEERMSRTPNTEAGETLDQLEAAMLLGEAAQLREDAENERAAADEAERDEIAAAEPDQEHAAASDVDEHRGNARAAGNRTGALEGDAAALRYDSQERRQQNAATIQSKGIDGDLIVTRMNADVSQGRPAGAAVGQKSATRARKRPGAGIGTERSRQDRGR